MKEINSGVAIIGNMCVGKSTLFSRMCKSSIDEINYPNSSVVIASGKIKGSNKYALDTPGTSSIFTHNEDERVSRDIFLSFGKMIEGAILVADAKNLKRSVALALQYAEYSSPMLFDVNMEDEALSRGIIIDYKRLSEILGISVCTSVATLGQGVNKIKAQLKGLKVPKKIVKYPPNVQEFINIVEKLLCKDCRPSPRGLALLLLAGDNSSYKYLEKTFGCVLADQLKNLAQEYQKNEPIPFQILLTNLYYKKAQEIVDEVVMTIAPSKNLFMENFGRWCMQLGPGIPIALTIIYLMYLFVGTFGATIVVDNINVLVFEGYLIPWSEKIVQHIPIAFIREMIIDPNFGILPTGVFLALGLVLPVLFCFYIFFGILEDSGYLPRLSFLLDKLFRQIGLNGKGVLPLAMGFSCITMAVLTTRMLDTKKEKNIATFLLILGFPCAPLLAVMFIILGNMPLSATFLVFGIIGLQILLAGYLANKLLSGKRSPLLLEIPAMRLPNIWLILKKAAIKTYSFMKEAIPVFVLASIVVFIFDRTGGLDLMERVLRPIINGLMGLPEKSVQVFIKTIIRRESGATELSHLSPIYNNVQLVVNLLVMTFLMPCINATIVIAKERGIKTAFYIISAVMVWSLVIGGIVNHTCNFLGITFT